jgi:hypothetical protein
MRSAARDVAGGIAWRTAYPRADELSHIRRLSRQRFGNNRGPRMLATFLQAKIALAKITPHLVGDQMPLSAEEYALGEPTSLVRRQTRQPERGARASRQAGRQPGSRGLDQDARPGARGELAGHRSGRAGGGVTSVRRIAEELNRRAILTPRGGEWHATSVVRLLKRLTA